MPGAIFHDPANSVLYVSAIAPQLLAATNTNTSLDMSTGDGRCFAQLHLGTFNATSIAVQVSECATTNGTYTNITGASVTALTNTTAILGFTFDRNLRYLKTVATFSGTTIGASLVIGESLKYF